jgi:hypothetical protein
MSTLKLQDVIDVAVSKGESDIRLESGTDYLVEETVELPPNFVVYGSKSNLSLPSPKRGPDPFP